MPQGRELFSDVLDGRQPGTSVPIDPSQTARSPWCGESPRGARRRFCYFRGGGIVRILAPPVKAEFGPVYGGVHSALCNPFSGCGVILPFFIPLPPFPCLYSDWGLYCQLAKSDFPSKTARSRSCRRGGQRNGGKAMKRRRGISEA